MASYHSVNILVLTFLTVVSLLASPARAQYDFSDMEPPEDQLYFTGLEAIDRFNTVTVFITKDQMNISIADTFFKFSRKIGRTNGATHVNANDYSRYSEVLNKLKCRPVSSSELPVVIFFVQSEGSCHIFPLGDPEALREVLLTIERNISCPEDLVVERVGQEIRFALGELCTAKPVVRGIVPLANGLIDFCVSRLRTHCKQRSLSGNGIPITPQRN